MEKTVGLRKNRMNEIAFAALKSAFKEDLSGLDLNSLSTNDLFTVADPEEFANLAGITQIEAFCFIATLLDNIRQETISTK